MKKDTIKIILLLLVLFGIIYGTVKINNADIKPIVTLGKNKETKKEKKETKKETKEEKKEESPNPDEGTEQTTPTEENPGGSEQPTPTEPTPTAQSIIPNPESKTILCSKAKQTATGTTYNVQLLGYYDRIGGSMNKMIIYTNVEATTMTLEERGELTKLLESELKSSFPSFSSNTATTDTESQVVLTGTPQDLVKDYNILDDSSVEYYNFAPTLRYEGFTCTIN